MCYRSQLSDHENHPFKSKHDYHNFPPKLPKNQNSITNETSISSLPPVEIKSEVMTFEWGESLVGFYGRVLDITCLVIFSESDVWVN